MLIYPDVLSSADIDADGIVAIAYVHSSVQLYMGLGLGTVAKSLWRNAAAIEAYRYYCLSVHLFASFWGFSAFADKSLQRNVINLACWCIQAISMPMDIVVILLPSAPTGFDVGHCVHPFVRPERHYHSNFLRISAISLKFGGMMHSNMKQIVKENGRVQPILPRSTALWNSKIG